MSKGFAYLVLVFAVVACAALLWGCGSSVPPAKPANMVFQCESSSNTFVVTGDELRNRDIYLKYWAKAGTPVECRLDGKMDAYWVYYCPVDKQYFRYTPGAGEQEVLQCPNGHVIPEENR